ncbi:unnamed protein product, partial [Acanthoscelides obtectus]
ELEERECDTAGKKAELQERLRQELIQEGEDPDISMFTGAGDIGLILQNLSTKLENKVVENCAKLEGKLLENCADLLENSAKLENRLVENCANVEGKLVENCANLKGKLLENVKTIDERQRGLPLLKSSEVGAYVGSAGHLRMKPPQFDGTTPWNVYRRQFEAAANANDWSSTEKATALTLPYEEMLQLFFKEYCTKSKRSTNNY